jgi:4,5-DOPA dioxygenase extradiol
MSSDAERMPAVFFGHGSPMNALGGPYAAAWRAIGTVWPAPRAVLMISAHWYVPELAVTAGSTPRTIHDFQGFPPELYQIQYSAPGAAWLAHRVTALLEPRDVRHANDWGFDHGTWAVLRHTYPSAQVPIVQLSIDRRQEPHFHYELGRCLAVLRDEGVLLAGSGDVVHNLRAMHRDGGNEPYDWALRFQSTVKAAITSRQHQALIDWPALGADARLAIPTAEHWLPLLYVLGAQHDNDQVSFFTEAIELGSISMLGVVLDCGNRTIL